MSNEIKSDKISIGELFKKFWYIIPSYQRPYVWQEDNVQELLEDLYDYHQRSQVNKNNKEEYFLGSMVLQKQADSNECRVLDGQQRLTTLLLILSVFRDYTNNFVNCDHYIKGPASKIKKIEQDRNRIEYDIRENVKDFFIIYVYNYSTDTDKNAKYEELKQYNSSKNISMKNFFERHQRSCVL